MSNTPLTWRAFGLTNVGAVRTLNEDALLIRNSQKIWLVADGMGGHSKGEYASQSIVDAFEQLSAKDNAEDTLQAISSTLQEVNTKLLQEASQISGNESVRNTMGSTVALIHAHQTNVYCVWAGDSRIYRLRKGELTQLTKDHSFVQDIVDKGEISDEEAQAHPQANIITRAVGVSTDLQLDVECSQAQPGDKYLLCTDGLFKDIKKPEIAQMLALNPIHSAQSLIERALILGANDNITVIVLEAI